LIFTCKAQESRPDKAAAKGGESNEYSRTTQCDASLGPRKLGDLRGIEHLNDVNFVKRGK
jgi:hypothetical protein